MAVVAAAAFALALSVCVGVLVALRSRREGRTDPRIADVIADLTGRMEAMLAELSSALERAEQESQRNRTFGELAGSIDLDEVLRRSLEAAAALQSADAALLALTGGGSEPVVVTLGLSQEEAHSQAIAGPPDGRPARSIAIRYRYADGTDLGDGAVHAGLAVPLHAELGQIGWLTVFTRSASLDFDEHDLLELEALAVRVGPAVENARRFREARQLADLDSLTGLPNRRYFHQVLARECARAHRYGRRLALVVLDLDDFKAINDRIGHLAGDDVLAEAAGRLRTAVRSADIACRVGGDEFAIVLPESGLPDAEQLVRRILEAVTGRPIGEAGRLLLSAGITELRGGDDAAALFQRGDGALDQAKEAGKGTVVAAVR
ncbi:MAG TPA: GGDEF domain-containing protein [Gaiellaceae bacterium]|nr:GGDEF domain-containing protein [Gaiellaceae bacterium]